MGGAQVINGRLTLGTFFAFNFYLLMLVMPMRMLGMWIGMSQRAIASSERIFQILDEPEDIDDSPSAAELPAGAGVLAFRDVSFGYEPDRLVLAEIDLELTAGKTVALIGHTGSGKSTLATLVPRPKLPNPRRARGNGQTWPQVLRWTRSTSSSMPSGSRARGSGHRRRTLPLMSGSGRSVAMVGNTGAGKSTLAKLLARS